MTVRFYFAFIAVPASFYSLDFYFVHIYFFAIMMYYFSLESVTELEEVGKPWASLVAQMVKNLPAIQETWVRSHLDLIPGLGISPGEGNGNPLQYSCLENSMNRRAWWATVHGVAKNRTRLSD